MIEGHYVNSSSSSEAVLAVYSNSSDVVGGPVVSTATGLDQRVYMLLLLPFLILLTFIRELSNMAPLCAAANVAMAASLALLYTYVLAVSVCSRFVKECVHARERVCSL